MSTRGAVGFRFKGQDKIQYNHCDSYPSYLGVNVVNFIKNTSLQEMEEIFDRIILVDSKNPAAPLEVRYCLSFKGLTDIGVSKQQETDWYCLLHNAQSNLNWYKKNTTITTDIWGLNSQVHHGDELHGLHLANYKLWDSVLMRLAE